ncbi:DUF402 domain-containing protein [Paenibacillus sp. GCM10023252]|uniref:DUF402 domain-containing protein n=1 Tax=Paenibacillus sp. GCM10023252 TaxID=3252649 RepID=UPI00360BB55A
MAAYQQCVIKSFKHNGHIHRTWHCNALIPPQRLFPEHAESSMMVLINEQTPIQEADGKQWISRVPAVSFFIPGEWFNVVALLEDGGIRYYCNIASPPYRQGNVITYIDYDLDVIRTVDGETLVVDEEEYERHKAAYHYPKIVDERVHAGLQALLQRVSERQEPFNEDRILTYYKDWVNHGKT